MIEQFDDLELGMRFKTAEVTVTTEDIKRFAAEFDPQPFHLDEAAAEKTVFKGLAASGWHTAAIAMRLCVEARPFGPQLLMGLGVDGLRWMTPVRPGDVLHVEDGANSIANRASRDRERSNERPTTSAAKRYTTFTPIAILVRHSDPVTA